MKNFKNKIVVITGAGSGMGRAYALAFARLGARLALNDINDVPLEETKQLAAEAGAGDIYTQVYSVGDYAATQEFAAGVRDALGDAQILINNAGIEGAATSVDSNAISDYERVMSVNFYGVVNGCKAFLPQLRTHKEAAIVNVSSVFGLIGTPNQSDYCATKFAVTGFSQSLTVELADSPISVHTLHPGGIATNISSDELAAKYLITPPEDVARAVIKAIGKKQPKIVVGNKSALVWFGANFVPTRILNAMIRREMSDVT